MNTIIEKIRAEVERRKVDYLNKSYTFVPKAMQDLLDFLSDLEKSEKPINHVLQDFPTTEKEMQDFLATHERIPVPERLNSLERILQEQPAREGLEEEIERIVKCEKEFMNFQFKSQLIGYVARHFAQWGAEHAKNEEEL